MYYRYIISYVTVLTFLKAVIRSIKVLQKLFFKLKINLVLFPPCKAAVQQQLIPHISIENWLGEESGTTKHWEEKWNQGRENLCTHLNSK